VSEELLRDPSLVLEATLKQNGWQAGPLGGPSVRLAGGTVDLHAATVTDVAAVPGTIIVRTRIPTILPGGVRSQAGYLCAAINATIHAGVVAVETDGTPTLTTKALLFTPEAAASSVITTAVKQNRELADALCGCFVRLRRGDDAAQVATDMGFADTLPDSALPRTPAQIDLDRAPEPNPRQVADASIHRFEAAERDALARLQALTEHNRNEPACAGPVVLHKDGTAECYGCDDPLERFHPAGASLSCTPGRALGAGHRCARCDATTVMPRA
jgi:hypothetical protein